MNIQLISLLTAHVTSMAPNPIINVPNLFELPSVNVAPIINRDSPPPPIQMIAIDNRRKISINLSINISLSC